ncbi:MAG: Crp/Fnr family transcriptional regulator [Chitinophagaceae bacterium]|jgi:CRP/FNR family transcriptional regulator|nr:Crp/Fnr family transcriptional regulator [Chitinophagaceae bacterium]MBK9383148.1 Crp/Fnr family transcriptional regulator [Chitinophagaceae bacterium]MBL0305853.1 Crp/Fnr family transcriptional regulator [Chitinophagaceae bacterium]HQV59776.1 Crp/Fnr family transcriptional regulator [Chitinophagaceae bacterium]HQV86551.1 Crp/Fnr family transcriptional regulator [Chitinophagaceae bacterium]
MNWKQLFPQFEPGLIEIIEKEAVQRSFNAGDIIMRTGQYIKSTALVLEGRVKIYRENQDGGEFLMYYLGPGQACAVSMICALQSHTSEIMAVAEEDSEVLMIPVQLMDDMMNKYKTWYQFVIQTYRGRFDELLSVVDNIAFRNMDERLEFYLKRYTEKAGKKTIDISHQQIADDLNSSREVISRLLKKMEQRNLVKLHRNMIELL